MTTRLFTHKHSFPNFSYESDDVVFERMTPSSPKRFDDMHRDPFSTHQLRHRSHRGSADHANGTPDSPISQVRKAFKDYASQSIFISF